MLCLPVSCSHLRAVLTFNLCHSYRCRRVPNLIEDTSISSSCRRGKDNSGQQPQQKGFRHDSCLALTPRNVQNMASDRASLPKLPSMVEGRTDFWISTEAGIIDALIYIREQIARQEPSLALSLEFPILAAGTSRQGYHGWTQMTMSGWTSVDSMPCHRRHRNAREDRNVQGVSQEADVMTAQHNRVER